MYVATYARPNLLTYIKKEKFYDDLSHKENPIITFFLHKQEFVPHAGIKSILKTNIPCYNITVMKLELHANIF